MQGPPGKRLKFVEPKRLPFSLQPRTPNVFGGTTFGVDFNFLKTTCVEPYCPEKNRENFRILQSHNILSSRKLQNNAEVSIYKNAEIGESIRRRRSGFGATSPASRRLRRTGKAEMSLKNLTTDGTDFGDALKDLYHGGRNAREAIKRRGWNRTCRGWPKGIKSSA